jgi:DNA polymerase-1
VPILYPDGMLHPGYTVLHTATARLSSTNPNIQNFPRRRNGEIRNMIEVPKGYVFLAFDYAQLEARILAMATKDKTLCQSIINSRDIHGDWRDNLLHIHPDYIDIVMEREKVSLDVDEKTLLKIIRDRVKNQFVFASFYGSSARSCAEAMGLSLGVLEELSTMLWSEFPDVKKWLKSKRVEYQATGAMKTLTDRVRYQILYKFNEPVNTPIQGTAADIVADAMNEMMVLSRYRKDPFLHPRIQVHDDLTFIVPDSPKLEYYVNTISEVLTKVRFPWQTVPLAVEAKIGTRWAELEEFAVFAGEYMK